MSTLRVTNVQDTAGANSLTTAQIYNGAAKAWVNFDGTGVVAIRASFNVSSITDTGTGQYTVNFTNAMTAANFSMSLSGNHHSDVALGFAGFLGVFTTTSAGFRSTNVHGNDFDNNLLCVSIFR
jgi:hypothetical protein